MSDPLPSIAVGPRLSPTRPTPTRPVRAAASPAVPAVRAGMLAMTAAVALAVFIRAFLVLSRDFPLNDGALFLQMAEELRANGFRLPATTAYNGAGIPFAYSPLGFYLAAGLNAVAGIEFTTVLRVLPLVFTSLCVVAFFLLARELAASRATVIAALCTFAVLPRSFLWLIMGGGLTRSIGFLFAILALWQLHRAYTRCAWRHVAGATAFASLTVLSHLGTAPFVAFSAALMLAFFGRHRFGVYASIAVALGTVVLTAPWWVSVASVHGFAPFAAAGATGGTVFSTHSRGQALAKLAYFGLGTAEPLFPIIGALAILGALASMTRRGAFLPIWWLTIILLDTRAGATYASIPVALLAGIALMEVVVPVVVRPLSGHRPAPRLPASSGWDMVALAPRSRKWAVGVVLAILLGYGIASSILRRPSLNAEGRYLTSLTRDDRAVMTWVSRTTPPTSRFLIVVGGAAGGWWSDRVGEWFPVLTKRVSVATVQGTEWLPRGTFETRERAYDQLQGCAVWGTPCIEQWAREHDLPYTHVYLPKTLAFPCCGPLDSALRHDSTYRVVFDGPAATIYARQPPPRWKSVENW
jgi:hypothetical protein